QERLVTFDYAARHWQFDLDRIRRIDITDNVVDLMAAKLRKLPAPTQEALKLAACIGNRFALPVLATVSATTAEATAGSLWDALGEGFVVPPDEPVGGGAGRGEEPGSAPSASPSYKFLHDRVQQAA